METSNINNKQIILGVSGSIACYKSVDLASKLAQAKANITIVMTKSAERFVSPLSFKSVTGGDVYTDIWSLEDHVRHVRLGEEADLLAIVPATAHTIAKLAHGLADNLLTISVLTARCPVLIAPAMDAGMYMHPATQANVAVLKDRGVLVAGPTEGRMASGLFGMGRMLEPKEIVGHIRLALGHEGPLAGRKIVVTAGPTRESIDPVRYLSNRSSGRQGYSLAQAAVDAGAKVALISGPVSLDPPIGVSMTPVNSAIEMSDAVLAEISDADVLIMAAAVADFRPAEMVKQKIKKDQAIGQGMGLPLVSNPDILERVKKQKERTGKPSITLGFAAETENIVEHGRDKLVRKALDFIAVNDVSAEDAGFDVDTNRIIFLGSDGRLIEMPLQSKNAIAADIISVLSEALSAKEDRVE